MWRTLLVLFLLAAASAVHAQPQADLSISSARADGLEFSFHWRNRGPAIAENVVFTVDIPAGTILRRIYIDKANCDYSRLPLRCTAGAITQVDSGNFLLDLIATESGTYTVHVEMTSDTADPNPADNSVTLTSQYTKGVDLVASTGTYWLRADAGGTAVAETSVTNAIPHIEATDLRVEYTTRFNATIVNIEPEDPRWSCTVEPAHAVCTGPSLDPGCHCVRLPVTLRAGAVPRSFGVLTMTVTSALPEMFTVNNQRETTLETYEEIDVTTTADRGAGSLRAAIESANQTSNAAIKIAFRIPAPVPSEGWFTIVPETPLPAITVQNVFVDGATQTAFTGDTNPLGPEIAIDGRLAHRGLEIRSGCESRVEHLAIGNFDENQALWFTGGLYCSLTDFYLEGAFARRVANNYIGVDPTGTRAWPNLRGILADEVIGEITDNLIRGNTRSGIWMWSGSLRIARNRIEANGASGILLGPFVQATLSDNAISFHPQMGVALVRSNSVIELHRNSMIDNGGLGIDCGLDGRTPDAPRQPRAPVLLSATFDPSANQMVVRGAAEPGALIELFANRGPDGDGERFVGSTIAPSTTFELVVPGDSSGQWLNATATQRSTSELSNAVLVK